MKESEWFWRNPHDRESDIRPLFCSLSRRTSCSSCSSLQQEEEFPAFSHHSKGGTKKTSVSLSPFLIHRKGDKHLSALAPQPKNGHRAQLERQSLVSPPSHWRTQKTSACLHCRELEHIAKGMECFDPYNHDHNIKDRKEHNLSDSLKTDWRLAQSQPSTIRNNFVQLCKVILRALSNNRIYPDET